MSQPTITVDGRPVVHVTRVTGMLDKPQLTNWKIKLAVEAGDRNAASAEARRLADRGHRIHAAALALCEGRPIMPGDPDDVVEHCTMNLRTWVRENLGEVFLAEKPVRNAKYLYGGQPDLVSTLIDRRGLWVIDWKGSRAAEVYYEWSLQLAAYAMSDEVEALARHTGEKVRVASVLVNPDGDCTPHMHEHTDLARRKNAFLCLLTAYNDREAYTQPLLA